jgi:hypothetical protein
VENAQAPTARRPLLLREVMYRRLINWLTESPPPPPKARAPRRSEPTVLVYYWDGSTPKGHELRDISLTGAYLYTSERWYIGTIVRLLIQAKNDSEQNESNGTENVPSRSIEARVVRHGSDGVALHFMFNNAEERENLERFVAESVGPSAPPSRPDRSEKARNAAVPNATAVHTLGG